MRTRYIYDHDLGRVVPAAEYHAKRQVHIISDNLGERLWNPAYPKNDPKSYTNSKSKMREMTRAAGCYEMGNDEPVKKESYKPLDVKGAYERAMRQFEYNND